MTEISDRDEATKWVLARADEIQQEHEPPLDRETAIMFASIDYLQAEEL